MTFKEAEIFTQTFRVSDETYKDFIRLSNDKHPLHTDERFAKSKGFKGRVMHGNILNAFLSYFIGECLPLKNVIIHSQEIQFENAVYLDDQLQFKAVVCSIYESVKAIEFKYDFRNDTGVIVAKGKIQIGLI